MLSIPEKLASAHQPLLQRHEHLDDPRPLPQLAEGLADDRAEHAVIVERTGTARQAVERLEPDAGCRWVTSDPADLRVVYG